MLEASCKMIGALLLATSIMSSVVEDGGAHSTKVASRCEINNFNEVKRNPLTYAGKLFCGYVFIIQHSREIRILANANDSASSSDLVFLVTSASMTKLRGGFLNPRRYYIEARIDPQLPCFEPSGGDEDCSPFRRPVSVHLLRARPARGR